MGPESLECEYSLLEDSVGSIKISQSLSSDYSALSPAALWKGGGLLHFQFSIGGGITGGVHDLRLRHKHASFHVRMAQSTFLIIWVKIRIRRRRV